MQRLAGPPVEATERVCSRVSGQLCEDKGCVVTPAVGQLADTADLQVGSSCAPGGRGTRGLRAQEVEVLAGPSE